MKIVRVLILVAMVVAPLAGSVGSASALLPQEPATCGMSISASVQLTNDLTCSGGFVLNITGTLSRTVIVDLGGHTMATDTAPAVGIQDNGGRVELQNGRIIGGAGDVGNGGTSLTVYNHVVFDGTGVQAALDTTRVQNSTFVRGANISGFATAWTVETSLFIGGSNGTAIAIDGGSATISRNRVSGYDTGISLTDTNLNVNLYRNDIYGAITGISVGGGASSNITGQIKANHVDYGRGDGIVLGDGAQTLVQSNNTQYNGSDGIRVSYGGGAPVILTFKANTSHHNAADGIDATASNANVTITDGGANHVTNNIGTQCLNLAC